MTINIHNIPSFSERQSSNLSAKPLNRNIKLSPKDSMVIFDLDGTLVREGIFLKKLLHHVTKKSFTDFFKNNHNINHMPMTEYLNRASSILSNKIEDIIPQNNSIESFKEKLSQSLDKMILDTIHPNDSDVFGSSHDIDKDTQKISKAIFSELFENPKINSLLQEGLSLYSEQKNERNKKDISNEVIKTFNHLATLGVPVSIVSNASKDYVQQASDTIFKNLDENIQKQWHDKDWFFTNIGAKRDEDGDLIYQPKPAPDMLVISHAKASRFNRKNERDPIKNVIMVGNSESFDMRSADNMQNSAYAADKDINVYKLLHRYDDPIKNIRDKNIAHEKSVLYSQDELQPYLENVFKNT